MSEATPSSIIYPPPISDSFWRPRTHSTSQPAPSPSGHCVICRCSRLCLSCHNHWFIGNDFVAVCNLLQSTYPVCHCTLKLHPIKACLQFIHYLVINNFENTLSKHLYYLISYFMDQVYTASHVTHIQPDQCAKNEWRLTLPHFSECFLIFQYAHLSSKVS